MAKKNKKEYFTKTIDRVKVNVYTVIVNRNEARNNLVNLSLNGSVNGIVHWLIYHGAG